MKRRVASSLVDAGFPGLAQSILDLLDQRDSALANYLAAHAGHELLSPDAPLGCGGWGCVYKTKSPDVVIKVTTDVSEAQAAQYLVDNPSEAFCHFYGVCFEKLTLDNRLKAENGDRLFFIWRESVVPVQKDSTFQHIETLRVYRDLGSSLQMSLRSSDSRSLDFAINYAIKSKSKFSASKKLEVVLDKLHDEYETLSAQELKRLNSLRQDLMAAAHLQLYIHTLDAYAKADRRYAALASGLKRLILSGVVPTDVRHGNIGISATSRGQYVCFDPGQTKLASWVKVQSIKELGDY